MYILIENIILIVENNYPFEIIINNFSFSFYHLSLSRITFIPLHCLFER